MVFPAMRININSDGGKDRKGLNMKKNMFLAGALVALMAVGAFAQTEKDFEVKKTADGKGIEITKYVGNATVVNIPPTIQNLPVKIIGDEAFNGQMSITSITIPNSVTSIGKNAFANCTFLTSVTIPSSVNTITDRAFFGCSRLASVTIGNGVYRIGTNAFLACHSLTSVTFQGPSVTSMDDKSFAGHGDLHTKYYVGKAGTYTKSGSGESAVWTKQDATTTQTPAPQTPGESDYQVTKTGNAVTITKYVGKGGAVSIPATIQGSPVTTIGGNSFIENASLTSVTIPNGVTSIGDGAFARCPNLTSVTISNSVTSIGYNVFLDCAKLTSVTLGSGVKSIEGGTFARTGITSITIPAGVTSIAKNLFLSGKLTSITIGSGVTSIGEGAFVDCTALTSVTFAGTIPQASIHQNVFPGDLRAKYTATGAGTYTRPNGTSTTWTKK
jgi:hypothetical protein